MKDEVSEHDLTTKRDAKKRKKEKKKDKKKKHRSKRHKGSDATTTASVEEEDGGNGTSSTSPRLLATPAMDPPQQSSGSSVNDTLDPSKARPVVESSALDFVVPEPVMAKKKKQESSVADDCTTTLLLFYQYVEPVWGISRYERAKKELGDIARTAGLTGRMRVAREGLNCTLTGPAPSIAQFCHGLREWDPVFRQTEFKLTHDLPNKQRFPQLKVIPVLELVHYGLEGDKAPPIHRYHGTHLEPADYHRKLAEQETVVIDVRNHYEAVIGRFDPPNSKWLDPKMRKSTSFPVWLDDPNTKKELANKQVLMYCTGGIRCERASALLKYKMETDPEMSQLNIKGVYQLQGESMIRFLGILEGIVVPRSELLSVNTTSCCCCFFLVQVALTSISRNFPTADIGRARITFLTSVLRTPLPPWRRRRRRPRRPPLRRLRPLRSRAPKPPNLRWTRHRRCQRMQQWCRQQQQSPQQSQHKKCWASVNRVGNRGTCSEASADVPRAASRA